MANKKLVRLPSNMSIKIIKKLKENLVWNNNQKNNQSRNKKKAKE